MRRYIDFGFYLKPERWSTPSNSAVVCLRGIGWEYSLDDGIGPREPWRTRRTCLKCRARGKKAKQKKRFWLHKVQNYWLTERPWSKHPQLFFLLCDWETINHHLCLNETSSTMVLFTKMCTRLSPGCNKMTDQQLQRRPLRYMKVLLCISQRDLLSGINLEPGKVNPVANHSWRQRSKGSFHGVTVKNSVFLYLTQNTLVDGAGGYGPPT